MDPLTPESPTRHFHARWRSLATEPSTLRSVRIGITASYTVEPILPVLGCFLAQRGLLAQFVVAPFNQIYQSLVDPIGPLRNGPLDATIVLPRLEELCGPAIAQLAHADPNTTDAARASAHAEIERLTRALLDYEHQTAGPVLCANFAVPATLPLGVLDATHSASEGQLRAELNLELWRRLRAGRLVIADVAQWLAYHGAATAYDTRSWHISRHPYSAAFGRYLAYGLARTLTPLFIAPAKVIVLDLDNTLWGGVIGEEGLRGIALGDSGLGSAFVEFQEALLALRSHGVLLCLASKNNETDVWDVFDKHPAMRIRRDHLAAWRVNWNRKPDSLLELARELALGLESFVFIDDNPVECEEVRQRLPQVTVLQLPEDPARYVMALRALVVLDRMMVTEEDRHRSEQYRTERERSAAQAAAGSDPTQLHEYLASLALVVRVREPSTDELPRVAQLTQKTNQFNVTTIRRTLAEVEALLTEEHWRVYVLDAADRFGAYGLVGVLIAVDQGGGDFEIDTLLLSCRVLGRGVESAFLAAVARDLIGRGALRLRGRFIPTDKNAPAREFFAAHGFVEFEPGRWLLTAIAPERLAPSHVRIELSETRP